jgi:hypothetical protein
MRSAFWRGVELLSEPESDSVQSRGRPVESPSKSASKHMQGINGVPKNATQLKPVIDKLVCKVIVITIRLVSVSANVI